MLEYIIDISSIRGKFMNEKRRTVLTLLVTILILIISSAIFTMYEKSIISSVTIVFQRNVESLANVLSVSFFQRSEMHDAFLKGDYRIIDEWFDEIIKNFPQIEKIEIIDEQIKGTDLFEIFSNETTIFMKFCICDSKGENCIPNKSVLVTVSAQKMLDDLLIRNIKISKSGLDFVYNLKYTFKSTVIDFSIFIGSLAIGLILVILYLLLTEIQTRRTESTEKLALEAIADLTQSLLKGVLEPTYQLLLQKAVQIIPGAQAGSVLIREVEEFGFSAVVGYDFETLSKLKFKPDELAQGFEKEIKIIRDIRSFDKVKLPEEKVQILKDAGKVFEIKSTLSIPIIVNDEIMAFLNLDNFESPNAFTELSIQIGKVFANQVGVIFERIKLEKELKEQKEKLEYLSLHEPLTELPNRRFLEIEGERLVALANRENKNVCLIYLDLKKFKPVNDKYGHDAGDYVLKVISERFKNVVRKSDFVARIGGDEFVFLLYDCKEYKQFVDRILEELEKDIYYNYVKINISGNFGIAIYPSDAITFGELITKGDMAMYYAKVNDLKYYLASELNIIRNE